MEIYQNTKVNDDYKVGILDVPDDTEILTLTDSNETEYLAADIVVSVDDSECIHNLDTNMHDGVIDNTIITNANHLNSVKEDFGAQGEVENVTSTINKQRDTRDKPSRHRKKNKKKADKLVSRELECGRSGYKNKIDDTLAQAEVLTIPILRKGWRDKSPLRSRLLKRKAEMNASKICDSNHLVSNTKAPVDNVSHKENYTPPATVCSLNIDIRESVGDSRNEITIPEIDLIEDGNIEIHSSYNYGLRVVTHDQPDNIITSLTDCDKLHSALSTRLESSEHPTVNSETSTIMQISSDSTVPVCTEPCDSLIADESDTEMSTAQEDILFDTIEDKTNVTDVVTKDLLIGEDVKSCAIEKYDDGKAEEKSTVENDVCSEVQTPTLSGLSGIEQLAEAIKFEDTRKISDVFRNRLVEKSHALIDMLPESNIDDELFKDNKSIKIETYDVLPTINKLDENIIEEEVLVENNSPLDSIVVDRTIVDTCKERSITKKEPADIADIGQCEITSPALYDYDKITNAMEQYNARAETDIKEETITERTETVNEYHILQVHTSYNYGIHIATHDIPDDIATPVIICDTNDTAEIVKVQDIMESDISGEPSGVVESSTVKDVVKYNERFKIPNENINTIEISAAEEGPTIVVAEDKGRPQNIDIRESVGECENNDTISEIGVIKEDDNIKIHSSYNYSIQIVTHDQPDNIITPVIHCDILHSALSPRLESAEQPTMNSEASTIMKPSSNSTVPVSTESCDSPITAKSNNEISIAQKDYLTSSKIQDYCEDVVTNEIDW